MDKFGIFNLLTSLIGNLSAEKKGETPRFSPAETKNPPLSPAEDATARAKSPPLTSPMLTAMRRHEEQLKRVGAKNKKQFPE